MIISLKRARCNGTRTLKTHLDRALGTGLDFVQARQTLGLELIEAPKVREVSGAAFFLALAQFSGLALEAGLLSFDVQFFR